MRLTLSASDIASAMVVLEVDDKQVASTSKSRWMRSTTGVKEAALRVPRFVQGCLLPSKVLAGKTLR